MGARILIVEDEQIIAADLRNKIIRLGHEVTGVAVAGEEAVSMAEQVRPDLVLMDVQLEGEMNGADAARVIQERTGARVIYITGYAGVFFRDPGQMTEPDICLGKPFSRIQLEAALRVALGRGSTGRDGH